MDIKEITGRNYYATKRRNLITNETSILDFLIKIEEEKEELCDSWIKQKSTSFDHKELADIVLVCFTMAQHFKIDLLMEMENKMLFNEIWWAKDVGMIKIYYGDGSKYELQRYHINK